MSDSRSHGDLEGFCFLIQTEHLQIWRVAVAGCSAELEMVLVMRMTAGFTPEADVLCVQMITSPALPLAAVLASHTAES